MAIKHLNALLGKNGKFGSYDPKTGGLRIMITKTEYSSFQQAFDYFNTKLFQGKLPPCLITFQRKARTFGYYSTHGFRHRTAGDFTDEIALNPATFEGRSDLEILSTLVHEMTHQYQRLYGNPGRGRYHNRHWADMMIERGLIPSDTGKPGGKQTGDRVSHYIREGGRFEQVCQELLVTGFQLNWQSVEKRARSKAKRGKVRVGNVSNPEDKEKFTCPQCGLNAWTKPSAALICGICYRQEQIIHVMKASPAKSSLVGPMRS